MSTPELAIARLWPRLSEAELSRALVLACPLRRTLWHCSVEPGKCSQSEALCAAQVEAYKYRSSENMMLKRTYSVNSAVQWGHRFVPIVKRSPGNFNNRPTVTWGQFHDTQAVASSSPGESGGPAPQPPPHSD